MKPVAYSLALLILAAGQPSAAVERSLETVRYAFLPKGRIAVENVNGGIAVQAWNRPEVELTMVKTAPDGCDCLGAVSVAVEQRGASLSFVTVYPGQSQEAVRVDYLLKVPRQTRLDSLRTVDGDISVEGIEGRVVAQTLRGDIAQGGVVGTVSDRALQGNIAVSLRGLPPPGEELTLETVSGDIDLILPPHPNANLAVRTVAGKVEAPYVFKVNAATGDEYERARLGGGGPMLRLKTVRGNIRVEEGATL